MEHSGSVISNLRTMRTECTTLTPEGVETEAALALEVTVQDGRVFIFVLVPSAFEALVEAWDREINNETK